MTERPSLTLAFLSSRPSEAARVLDRLDPATAGAFLAEMPARVAVGPLAAMVAWRAGRCLAAMRPEQAGPVIEALPAERAPECLRAMPAEEREAILSTLAPRRARALRRQLSYAPGVVGACMDASPLALAAKATAEDAREALRSAGRSDHVQLHVLDEGGRPCGAVRLADLLGAAADRPLSSLLLHGCRALPADMPITRVEPGRDWNDWPERPVVDARGRLVGAVTLARLVAAQWSPGPRLTAGQGPLAVLLQAFAAAMAGLGRLVGGLITTRGARRDEH